MPKNPNVGTALQTLGQGIAPWLAAIYRKAGMVPTGRGSGFGDYQYWQNEAVQHAGGDVGNVAARLTANLGGTGPDNPEGTEDTSGPWMNSGRQPTFWHAASPAGDPYRAWMSQERNLGGGPTGNAPVPDDTTTRPMPRRRIAYAGGNATGYQTLADLVDQTLGNGGGVVMPRVSRAY